MHHFSFSYIFVLKIAGIFAIHENKPRYFLSLLFLDLAANSSKILAARVDAMMIVSGSMFLLFFF